MIHCIGDSHVYVFSGTNIIQGIDIPFFPRTDAIGGVDVLPFFKTYRFSHTAYNVIKRRNLIERIIMTSVKTDDMIMFCFGEIDCRVHLLKQSELQNKSLISIVSECVDRYFEIFHIAKQYGIPLLAWNVPASSREDVKNGEYSTYGSCKERNKATQLFNKFLQKRCEESGVIFVSIFDKLIGNDGLTDTSYYLDSIHLSQKTMPLILDELRRQGVTLKTAAGDLKWEMDTRWRVKQPDLTAQKHIAINIVYEHLQKEQVHSLHRGCISLIWSPLPLEGFDVYAYLNSSSFRGKQPGLDILMMLEPIVVLPGEYNEAIWNHFDHIFTLCDALLNYGQKFTKILFPRSDWIRQVAITEDIQERVKKYPLENKTDAICMINGCKKSEVPSELYSKRIEAAKWFHENSDIPFDVYGTPPFPLPNFKGSLAPDAKLDTLYRYKYCLCFENTDHPKFSTGYITEKILDCFETRTVPIYLGSVNIEKYIPRECFIDFRKFADFRGLADFMHSLSDEEYGNYIKNIDSWVARGGLRPYSWHTIYNQVAEVYAAGIGLNINDLFSPESNWSDGISPSFNIRKFIPVTTSPLWTWSDLANGTSQLLTNTVESGTALNNNHVLHLQNIKKTEDGSLSIEFLKDISNVFGLDTFIETGTYLGDTSYEASKIFQSVHTIELSADLYQKAMERFKNNTNIHVYNGDSGKIFPELLRKINGKVFFWLDGHYSEGGTAKGDENTPIIKEIRAIKESSIADAVILVDDLRFFDAVWDVVPDNSSSRGYPSADSLCSAIREIDKAYKFAAVGDIFMAYPASAAFDVTPVVASCTVSRLYDGTNFDLEQVMEAETAIGKAKSTELFALQNLFATCVGVEVYGLAKHYRLWHALILASHKDHVKACKEFLMAMNLGFDHWRINWYLAKSAYMAGLYTLASEQLTTVLMAAPDYIEAQQLLEQVEARKKNNNEENLFSSQDRIELALHYKSAAKYDKAINELEAGILCDPDNPDIRFCYAKLYTATKQYEKAIAQLQKVLNLNSTYAPAHNDLGEIYTIMGDLKKALEHFKQAVSIDNKQYNALVNILNILIKAGNFEDAANIFKPLLGKSPDDVYLLKIAEQLAAIVKKGNRMPAGTASSNTTKHETPPGELKKQTSEYYQDIRKHYQLASASVLIDKFVHPVWIKQLSTLGEMITAGLPDNFLLHPICLEMFVRAGWNPQQEYELAYIESLSDRLRNKILSLKESSTGQAPYDCKKLNISVNTLGMLWYYARISEFLIDSPSSIVEFGGGFGSLSRIFKTLNDNSMTYTIIDLPEMLSLQYYYLSSSLGHDAVAAHIAPEEKVVPGKINLFPVYGIENLNILSDLFISTFAVSETPETTQKLACIGKNFFNAPCIYITGQLIGERKELSWQTPNTIVMSALHLRKHTVMNRFHIGNNYELMASQKMVGMKSDMMSERQKELDEDRQKAQNKTSCSKGACLSHMAVAVVFSKDRAMQLDCTLRSFMRHCKDIETIAVKVLYTTSNASHENQYRKIKADYPSVEFIREKDFKSDLLFLLTASEYVLFLVDDNVFVNDFYVDLLIEGLKQVPDAIGFSLRLGHNTTYCYMLNKTQALPGFDSLAKGAFGYDWTTAEYDFGYPLEVSSSIYRLADILPLLAQGDYKNPNTLELLMDSNKAVYKNNKNKLLCFENSVAFCNPLNMVQTMWVNRSGNKNIYTSEKLSQMFAQGFRIDTDALSGFTPHSCHQEIEFKFIRHSSIGTMEMASIPLVSIMIISYNGIDKIKECIESIKRNTPESHEIVVVDNARNDGSLDYVKTVPGTVLIANPTNIGYSPARAQAMSLVKGKYIVSLDDDTIVTKGWVSKFIKHAENHPEVGIFGPRSNFVSGPQIVKDASYHNIDELESFAEAWSSQNSDHLTQAIRLVGFCMFISRKVIDEIGCIDPNFGKLFGFDDDDYSIRAQIAGFKIMIADDIYIHHTGGPQGRGDKVYNKLMFGAWEMFKEKWNLKRDMPYGSPYDIAEVLSRKFDKKIHYSPLYKHSDLENLRIFQADAASETPCLARSEFIPGLTSIVILTRNRLDRTKKCVKSIRKHTQEPHEIIFVDNGSTDGTVKWLRSQVKENKNCRLISNNENIGSAKGRNQGINLSQGEFILPVDNDIVVGEGWFSGMMECLNRAPAAGIIGPMTNNVSGLQHVIDNSYGPVDCLDQYAAQFKEQYRHRQIPCRNIAGFCMLFKRRLTEKIGLLDERFSTGRFADEDFCLRASLEDYRNYIAGDVFIHHHGGEGSPGDRKIIEEKWVLGITSPEGKKLAVLKTTELADDLFQKGKTDQAAEALIHCIKITPEAREIYYALARIFIESRRFAEAWEVVDSMPESAREGLKGLESAGYAKEGLGLDDDAVAYADRILSLDANYPAALNLKGVLAYKKGEKERAADYFHKAIDADPCYGEAYTNLGVLHWTAGEKEEALDDLKKGFVLSPTAPDHSTLYHSAVASLEKYSDAESVFREARGLYPNNKNIAFLYIDALIRQGKFSVDMTEIEDAVAAFGLDEGILAAALSVREKIGPRVLHKRASKKATLSVCMIVKNEEEQLVRCLKSVRDVVDEMIVVDTGSTDRTKDIAKVFGAKVFDFPWTGDFSEARNHSLARATGDWILILDADEVISILDHKLLRKTIDRGKQRPVAFDMVTRNYLGKSGAAGWTENDGSYPQEERGIGWSGSNKVRLCRNNGLVRFENPVHELLEASLHRAGIPIERCTIPIHHYGRLNPDKILAKGREYYLLGRKKMEERGGGDYVAVRELAVQAGELGMSDEAIDLWQQALALQPEDADSLLNLAYHYVQTGKYQEGLQAAKRSFELSPGTKDAVLNYALCEMFMGNVTKATVILEEFVSGGDENTTLMAVLGVSYCVGGYEDKGLDILKKLAKRRVNNVPYYVNSLVGQLITSGQIEYANRLIEAALSGNIADSETLRLRAEHPTMLDDRSLLSFPPARE